MKQEISLKNLGLKKNNKKQIQGGRGFRGRAEILKIRWIELDGLPKKCTRCSDKVESEKEW